MTDIEHLIENGLDAVEEAKGKGEDTFKAFWEAMDAWHNQEMLKNVSMTKDELWEAVQYLVYTYCWCCPKRAEIENLKADKEALINGQETLQKNLPKVIRAEAIKEFAEKLTQTLSEFDMSSVGLPDYDRGYVDCMTAVEDTIDSLVEEMTEEK